MAHEEVVEVVEEVTDGRRVKGATMDKDIEPKMVEDDEYEELPDEPTLDDEDDAAAEDIDDDEPMTVDDLPSGAVEAAVVFEGTLTEAENGIRRDGTVGVKVIQEGWGTSGYYPANVLERDAKVFEGAHMYWNHPTSEEATSRPERDLRDLAGVLTGVRWRDDMPDGAGVYGTAKVFAPYRESLAEIAPYIGVSIVANGKLAEGEAQGRKGKVVESITSARSVDFVTKAGAGGKVVGLFESARDGEGVEVVSEERLREAESKVAELEEQVSEFRAKEIATAAVELAESKVAEADLSDIVAEKVMESIVATVEIPLTEDGELDESALAESVEAVIKSEVEYLARLNESGVVKGLGEADEDAPSEGVDIEESLTDTFVRMGMSESAAKEAARGR